MSDRITWTNGRRRLSELQPWSRNPRQIKRDQAERLVDSFSTFGQVKTIAIGPNGEIYDGHQRLDVLMDRHGADYEVDVRIASRPLSEREREKLTVYLHKGATGEWDFGMLANEFEFDGLVEWGFSERELEINFPNPDARAREIIRSGRLYNAGHGHDIEPFKLAHRIEASWQARGGLCLDLFSGIGQLAAWYRRRFERVVTVDKNFQPGDVDFSMSCADFIHDHLEEFMDFDFVDFDDEGSPGREIQKFFRRIEGRKEESFVLALTDGNGLNTKIRGRRSFGELYLADEYSGVKPTREDYYNLDQIIAAFIQKVASMSGFDARQLSNYRRSNGNAIYQTWLMTPVSDVAERAMDCDNPSVDRAGDHA